MKLFFIMLLVLAFPALAQEGQSEAVCKTLTQYKKVNDVTYTPGVDVRGNAVLPADVNAPVTIIENVTRVPLTVDLAERLSSLQGKGFEMQGDFGMLEIHPDGRVLYGDQDFTSDVKTLCGIAHEVKEIQGEEIQVEELQEQEIIPEIKSEILEGGEYRE